MARPHRDRGPHGRTISGTCDPRVWLLAHGAIVIWGRLVMGLHSAIGVVALYVLMRHEWPAWLGAYGVGAPWQWLAMGGLLAVLTLGALVFVAFLPAAIFPRTP